jgi:hypothetical protein
MTSRHRRGHRPAKDTKHVRLHEWLMRTEAWRSLDPVARVIYIELCRRYSGSNNGRISFSVRQAADELSISKDTAGRGLQCLADRGFIRAEQVGSFTWKKRHATEWGLTEFGCDRTGALSSKDFARWTPQNHNTVRPEGPTVPVVVPIGPCNRTVKTETPPYSPSSRTVRPVLAVPTVR